MEIGGHDIDHANLTTVWADPQYTTDAQRTAAVQHQACDDRTALVSHGFNPLSFAYPNGGWELNNNTDDTTIPNIVKGCGYTSARTTQGIAVDLPDRHCDLCYAPLSDLTPSLNRPYQPFGLRANQARGDTIAAEGDGTSAAEPGDDALIPAALLKQRTQLAIDAINDPKPTDVPNTSPANGGWLILVLHDVCKDATTLPCSSNTSVQSAADHGHSTTRDELNAYLDWLETETTSQCVIVTTVGEMTSGTEPTTCPAATDPGSGGGGGSGSGSGSGSGGGSTPGGGSSTGGSGGGSSTAVTNTPTTTPVDAPVETPVATPPVTVAQAPSKSEPAAPTVRLLTASSKLLAKGIVGFRAVVKAPAGVKRVEFLVNGKVVGTATAGSYRFNWSPKATKTAGKVRKVKISVRVIDSRGRVVQSAASVSLKLRLVTATKSHR
jgi:hypothetical protein